VVVELVLDQILLDQEDVEILLPLVLLKDKMVVVGALPQVLIILVVVAEVQVVQEHLEDQIVFQAVQVEQEYKLI
jgi:hypothetical protein